MKSCGRQRAGGYETVAVVALSVLLTTLVPSIGLAQEEEPAFTPALFVLGSSTNDELRRGGAPGADSSLFAELEIPFTFRGPRWTGGLSLNPAWRKQRELAELDSFDSSIDGWLSGSLSPRTRLDVNAAFVRSAQPTALDRADIVTPRSDRVRGAASARLDHELNRVGDRVTVQAGAGRGSSDSLRRAGSIGSC